MPADPCQARVGDLGVRKIDPPQPVAHGSSSARSASCDHGVVEADHVAAPAHRCGLFGQRDSRSRGSGTGVGLRSPRSSSAQRGRPTVPFAPLHARRVSVASSTPQSSTASSSDRPSIARDARGPRLSHRHHAAALADSTPRLRRRRPARRAPGRPRTAARRAAPPAVRGRSACRSPRTSGHAPGFVVLFVDRPARQQSDVPHLRTSEPGGRRAEQFAQQIRLGLDVAPHQSAPRSHRPSPPARKRSCTEQAGQDKFGALGHAFVHGRRTAMVAPRIRSGSLQGSKLYLGVWRSPARRTGLNLLART